MCDRGEWGELQRLNLSHPYPVPGTVNNGERRLKHFLSLGDCINTTALATLLRIGAHYTRYVFNYNA
jgi:hypothetical protein